MTSRTGAMQQARVTPAIPASNAATSAPRDRERTWFENRMLSGDSRPVPAIEPMKRILSQPDPNTSKIHTWCGGLLKVEVQIVVYWSKFERLFMSQNKVRR